MFDHLHRGQWWDIGLDLVTGCTPISPACENCWSAARTHRAGFQKNPKIRARYAGLTTKAPGRPARFIGEVRPQWQDLDKIGAARKPSVYSLWNDLFHPGVPEEFIDAVLWRIGQNLRHFFIICTKRPERALEMFIRGRVSPDAVKSWNLMLMTTMETQAQERRVADLLQIPGVLHGVSLEPLLGEINIFHFLGVNMLGGRPVGIDWVVAGGETGPYARPTHPDWFRRVRDDCAAAGVPFIFKSWGEWYPSIYLSEEQRQLFWQTKGKQKDSWGILDIEGNWHLETTPWNGRQGNDSREREYVMYRISKKAASRLLDGREWNEVPQIPCPPPASPGT
jgi:protein gp37